MNRNHQKGVALVTSLIMLSVITFLAVAFLAVTRRDRASVTTAGTQTDARLMADAGLARAQSEVLSEIISKNKKQTYTFRMSKAFSNDRGFDPEMDPPYRDYSALTNVNFSRNITGNALTTDEFIQNIGNLYLDPQAPVFVPYPRAQYTNWGPYDFRFYLDLNRNQKYDTNGPYPVARFDFKGRPLGTNVENYVGDPEWIGVLEKPQYHHSGTNRFIGRYAYVVMPISKTLDINFIHNQAKRPAALDRDGFLRNQGVGSWEINLAAFLHDLNTNQWDYTAYDTDPNRVSRGTAFEDAVSILTNRYDRDYKNLAPAADTLAIRPRNAPTNTAALSFDLYSDGPILEDEPGILRPFGQDVYTEPWPGSDNPVRFYNLQELFDPRRSSRNFVLALNNAASAKASSADTVEWEKYQRHTYYRLLEQMGTDSEPEIKGKLHLNYDTRNTSPTNMIEWDPLVQFTNIANRLLSRYHTEIMDSYGFTNFPPIPIHRIPIYVPGYPTIRYNAAVHRILQVAANIVEATSANNAFTPTATTNKYPFVFRPLCESLSGAGGTNFITGFELEVTPNIIFNASSNTYAEPYSANLGTNQIVFGIPWVVGATKNYAPLGSTNRIGFPNFNEFSLETVVQMTRKLQLKKINATNIFPRFTNEMYLLSISNRFGIEAWNSYTQAFPRSLQLYAFIRSTAYVTNEAGLIIWPQPTNSAFQSFSTNFSVVNWPAATGTEPYRTNSFLLPLLTNTVFLNNLQYSPGIKTFTSTNNGFETTTEYVIPNWGLVISNSLFYVAVDSNANRIVDFVNVSGFNFSFDFTKELMSEYIADDLALWNTNRLQDSLLPSVITEGARHQIDVSQDSTLLSNPTFWESYTPMGPQGPQKAYAMWAFRKFMGKTVPNTYPSSNVADIVSMETPFNPTRKFYSRRSWQVNDPFVHHTLEDLKLSGRPPQPQVIFARDPLPPSNLGELNDSYNPWGGRSYPSGRSTRDPSIGGQGQTFAFDVNVKDAQVDQSDDWDFPTNKFPSIGWLGRVHRGTPWQTIYLKASNIDSNAWFDWSGSYWTYPVLDHAIVDFFTAAPNENAARGLLSINQNGLASWSAVLTGVPVLQLYSNDMVLTPLYISPVGIQQRQAAPDGRLTSELGRVIEGINNYRTNFSDNVFTNLSQFLGTPELTVQSPYLRDGQWTTEQQRDALTDLAIERIPQQILSLLKVDENPRFVIYSWGQSLKPADKSLVQNNPSSRPDLFNVSTNYAITGEFATRTVIRMEGNPDKPRAVVESYNVLPSAEGN